MGTVLASHSSPYNISQNRQDLRFQQERQTAKPRNFKSLLFPLPLKVNFYVTPETNSMESGAEGTYGLFPPSVQHQP